LAPADGSGAVAWLTSAVQAGFILGTLVYAGLGLSDRFAADRVFAVSGLAGAAFNAAVVLVPDHFEVVVGLRFLTGITLGGIYPVGMKLAASWHERGLGRALGLLVGALVLGTAFPHLLRTIELPWRPVLLTTSGAALIGSALVGWFVPQGPHVTTSPDFSPRQALAAFRRPRLLRASLGYFGHMWELYAFWAFVPAAVAYGLELAPGSRAASSWSFAVIGVGAIGCAVGGWVSMHRGSATVAIVQLGVSGSACLLSPWVLGSGQPALVGGFLLLWGITVVGDSPQFSALGAQAAPRELVGTALTLMNAAGFGLTMVSVGLLAALSDRLEPHWLFIALAPGPLLGLVAMLPLRERDA